MPTFDSLVEIYKQVHKDNPAARSDTVLSRKLFRKAVRNEGSRWEDAAFDYVHDHASSNVHLEEAIARRQKVEAQQTERVHAHATSASPSARFTPTVIVPPREPAVTWEDREAARVKGKDRFTQNREAVEQMRFANGLGILQQTIADVQSLGSWSVALIRALPKTAKSTDLLGKFLTMDQVTKLRTFDVTA